MQSLSTAFEVLIKNYIVQKKPSLTLHGEDLFASMQEIHSQSGLI